MPHVRRVTRGSLVLACCGDQLRRGFSYALQSKHRKLGISRSTGRSRQPRA